MPNRYWCGACEFRTPWLDETEGVRQYLGHYALKHPAELPDGQVESRRFVLRPRTGCLLVAALLVILLYAVGVWRR
ncbi:hypothetical protein ABT160_35520 [Streptomyces sp. NPDC001941]|uniref:hypothetical protein n=1 Tax=Streptomyces sp. NPDC001941 TaxID=3154659 RepID=UPI0033173CF2